MVGRMMPNFEVATMTFGSPDSRLVRSVAATDSHSFGLENLDPSLVDAALTQIVDIPGAVCFTSTYPQVLTQTT